MKFFVGEMGRTPFNLSKKKCNDYYKNYNNDFKLYVLNVYSSKCHCKFCYSEYGQNKLTELHVSVMLKVKSIAKIAISVIV